MAIGVLAMSALACAVGLVRDTTGHDWYATVKLTLTELLIGIGRDAGAQVEYRTSGGEVLMLTRRQLWSSGDALVARGNLRYTARQSAELGAWCGVGVALLHLVPIRRRRDERRTVCPVCESAKVQQAGARNQRALPEKTPESTPAPAGSESGQPVAAAPARESADPPVGSRRRHGGNQAEVGKRRADTDSGRKGETKKAAHRRRRKRDYGRWI